MTTNNHPEMKTVVQTFIIEETAELIYDGEKLDQWNKRIEELGLTGQTQIAKPDKSPIPFMHLKSSMVAILETLCPAKVAIESYSVTPIPVEILDLIALAKRECYFDLMEIWYDEKSPDPVCVGVKQPYYAQDNAGKLHTEYPTYAQALAVMNENGWTEKKPYASGWSSNRTLYLLGKWGDVKYSFEELKELATKRFIDQQGAELRKTIKDSQRKLDDLATEAFTKFN